ncbi:hypothetical protein J1N35_044837 [Gossypium stocksii]|uniref:Profilin n=1 Tax=Gossypium stocksii TaxID=47602 RepID=A0A9D3ZGT2_9ROSI|nr:hypothetical protein J1N35_044837 [Gossypium stocksii]
MVFEDVVASFKPEEITGIMNDFAEPGSLALTGLYLGKKVMLTICSKFYFVYDTKKSHVHIHSYILFNTNIFLTFSLMQMDFLHVLSVGPRGVTIKKTNLALIIRIYDEPMTLGQCNMIVERLGDYLIDQVL